MKNRRARFSDPRPANVTIPTPPGHARKVHTFGPRVVVECACGWESALLSPHDADVDYDKHLDSFGSWCDFCGGLWPITRTYRCRPFAINFGTTDQDGALQTFVYDSDWLACGPCEKLVDGQHWQELAERCVRLTMEQQVGAPLPMAVLATDQARASLVRIRFLHQQFDAHRRSV